MLYNIFLFEVSVVLIFSIYFFLVIMQLKNDKMKKNHLTKKYHIQLSLTLISKRNLIINFNQLSNRTELILKILNF